jgi:biotin operon repressor
VRELKTKIVERLAPTFSTQRSKIRNEWEQKKRDAEKAVSSTNEEIGVSGKHSATNKFLKNTKESLLKNNKANKEDNDEKIARKVNPDASETEIAKVIAGLKENGITIDEREFIGDAFIDIEHGNQLKTLIYNTNSTFYKAYIDILNELREQHAELADNYRTLIDLIFVGYMLAEAQIDPDEEIDGAAFADELKQYWALNLSKILKKWNK